MKKIAAILVVLLLLMAGILWFFLLRSKKVPADSLKAVPIVASKHSDGFNRSIDSILQAYFKMTDGFYNADTAVIMKFAIDLKTSLDHFPVAELEADSLLYETVLEPISNARIETDAILQDPSLEEQKGSLNILSDNLRNILVVVRYDRAKLYWQESPVAFNNNNSGNWLSPEPTVRNPYLGIHSRYPVDSKEYGGPKDTINFIGGAEESKK